MNNNLSVLWRFLLDAGYDATLLTLPGEPDHFSLSADSFRRNHPIERVSTLELFDLRRFLSIPPAQIRRAIKPYDFVIACGASLGFLSRAGIPIDLAIPYGAEFLDHGSYRLTRPNILHHFNAYVYWNKQAFRHSINSLMLDYTNPWYESFFEKQRSGAKRYYLAPPMIYAPEFSPETMSSLPADSDIVERFAELRRKFDLVVFHHSSHNWRNPRRVWTYKGNHNLFIGFAEFKRKTGANACIVTFEYGLEVDETKKLIGELGIESEVYWFAKTPRKNLLQGIHRADVVVGEMNPERSFNTYGVALEAMAMGRPLMHHRQDSLYHRYHKELYPMLNASSPEDVEEGLTWALQCPAERERMGEQARLWFNNYGVEKPLALVEQLIAEKAGANWPSRKTGSNF
ncbi:MAG: glycosyltransferase [Bdellovibrionales bacterium]|nr:glycosyltransferase [Bdellovibrionales bacterium]